MRLALFNNPLFIEIRQASVKVVHGEESLELALDRQPNGRLTPSCQEKVTSGLQSFLKRKGWQPRLRAVCAIDARGVSMRRLNLPANGRQDLTAVLRLQIESEFPVPPDELAWGCIQRDERPARAETGQRDLTVVAVKKDILDDYARMLAAAGVTPVFTLAALARSWSFPGGTGSYAVLDIGRHQSELMTFENGAPAGLRILGWGGEQITREIETRLSITYEQAEKLKLEWDEAPAANGEIGRTVHAAIASALDGLAAAINENWRGQNLYVTGRSARHKELPKQLAERLTPGTRCERIESPAASNRSAAIAGLQSAGRVNGGEPPLILRLKESRTGDVSGKSGAGNTLASWKNLARETLAQPSVRKWARLSAMLALVVVAFPFVEPLVMKQFFVRRLATVKAEKGRLGLIDREFNFLQYLKQNQPPYLDTIALLACSVGPGSHFDSISMNRRGELAIKGSLKDANQVSDFRSKLIKTGFFSNVTVEEQTPTQDRQKFNVRMTAQIKPAAARAAVSVDTILSNAPPVTPGAGGFGGFGGPDMMFPGGGMPMPPPMEMRGGTMPPGKPPMRLPDGEKSSMPKADKGRTNRTIKVGDTTVEITPSATPSSEPATPPDQP
jgi:Tfp pilus assembly PilM family ATPase